VVPGHDAVLSALGGSTLLSRDSELTVGVHNIINAMEQSGVCRLIYLSADMVPEARTELNPLRRYVVGALVLRNVGADHELNERLIMQSRLDWVVIRPPVLTCAKRVKTNSRFGGRRTRKTVASVQRFRHCGIDCDALMGVKPLERVLTRRLQSRVWR